MTRKILSVGQCRPDHSSLSHMLTKNFNVEIDEADLAGAAIHKASQNRYDLILINRKLDADYSDGLDIIRSLKADPTTADMPVMLVTNYPEYQTEAVALGALPGFGKSQLNDPLTQERLGALLS